jgi:hypothetical protein
MSYALENFFRSLGFSSPLGIQTDHLLMDQSFPPSRLEQIPQDALGNVLNHLSLADQKSLMRTHKPLKDRITRLIHKSWANLEKFPLVRKFQNPRDPTLQSALKTVRKTCSWIDDEIWKKEDIRPKEIARIEDIEKALQISDPDFLPSCDDDHLHTIISKWIRDGRLEAVQTFMQTPRFNEIHISIFAELFKLAGQSSNGKIILEFMNHPKFKALSSEMLWETLEILSKNKNEEGLFHLKSNCKISEEFKVKFFLVGCKQGLIQIVKALAENISETHLTVGLTSAAERGYEQIVSWILSFRANAASLLTESIDAIRWNLYLEDQGDKAVQLLAPFFVKHVESFTPKLLANFASETLETILSEAVKNRSLKFLRFFMKDLAECGRMNTLRKWPFIQALTQAAEKEDLDSLSCLAEHGAPIESALAWAKQKHPSSKMVKSLQKFSKSSEKTILAPKAL